MSEVDRLYDVRDEVDRAAQAFGAAARPRREQYEGSNESGAVTVRVSADGVLTDVRVAMGWRDRVGATGLPSAVLAAVVAAVHGRLEDWGAGLEEVRTGPAPRVRPAPGLYDTLAGRLEDHVRAARTPTEVAAVQAALVDVMDELVRSVEEVTADVDAALTATVSGVSGKERHVVAELGLASDLVALAYDDGWLERAHPANIGRETVAAVDDARRALAGRSVSDVVARSRLARMTAMFDDPDAVSRRLGL